MFVPVKYFEKLIDESFDHNEFDFVHLGELCVEQNIKWNLKLLYKFKRLISEFRKHEFFVINENTNIRMNFKIVEEFKDDINWGSIIHFNKLKWTLPKLLKYKTHIKFKDYSEYSATGTYREIGFSLNLKTDWNSKTIASLSDYWNWRELCLNKYINWDIPLINTFIDKVDFESLSSNSHINWNIELIEEFKDRYNWQILSGNPSLPWSLKLLKRYEYLWKWNVEYNSYTDTGSEGQEVYTNYYPSISTNPGIIWDKKMISFGKNKLDFWRLARRGNLSIEVIKKIKKELYRKEKTGWVFHKSSDFSMTENIYLSGWENLAKNKLFKLSPEVVEFLIDNKIELTYPIGDFARGGQYKTSTFQLIEIFKNSTFVNINYLTSIIDDENLRKYFINNDFINDEIWEKIIAVYIIKYKRHLLNKFKKIKDL
jgi:hypothetical protein